MKTKDILIITTLLGLIIFFFACNKSEEDRIVNEWQLVSIDGNTLYGGHDGTSLTINGDGTFARKDYIHIIQSHYELKEIGGNWTKTNNKITFLINDMEYVTVMVHGLDSTYTRPCEDTWNLISVTRKELVLAHNQTTAGCFKDSYSGTTYKFIKKKN
jgi:hypothetical protein